jgi:glucose-6-phosphate 1-dehydrogenase
MIHVQPTHIETASALPDRKPDACIMIIFGASGDLTQRKLIPALYQLAADNQLSECFHVVGFARSRKDQEDFRTALREGICSFARLKPVNEEILTAFLDSITYYQGDYSDLNAYSGLLKRLEEMDRRCCTGGNRLFYLATPPSIYTTIIDNLHRSGLVDKSEDSSWSRVIIEKPFGRDLQSARQLNKFTASRLDESQTYRIDHYLGKETVQNILIFRFANAIFEPLWNRNNIDHVQITAAESIAVDNRGSFYDQAGVIRDFVQNHLLEVMALCAMEQPISFQADPIRDEKAKVIRSLQPLVGDDVVKNVVMGQYQGYHQVKGVESSSRTPTYAALKVLIDNWRWQGVPFYLRAGKSLTERVTEIAVHFRRIPLCLFGQDEVCQRLAPNVLKIRIQPKEGISLQFVCKTPGDNVDVSNVFMDFCYADAFGKASPDAYERLLIDAMRGDATLFARHDSVEHAWTFITPILEYFENNLDAPVYQYEPGAPGPKEADQLLNRDGRVWDKLE